MAAENRKVKVTHVGDEPSGLAAMLSQYFEQNINDFSRKNIQALAIRGKLTIEAVEGDVAVTIDFKGNEIEIAEGRDSDAKMMVRGGIFSITELATGGAEALAKIVRHDIEVRSAWRHPVFAMRVARFMSLPGELRPGGIVSEAGARRWKLVVAGACGIAAMGLAAYFLVN